MRADYDSQGDTIEIELEIVKRLDRGVDHGGAIVHLVDERPVVIDVLDASKGADDSLAAVADEYGLDFEALTAAARAALAAPDRRVSLDVGVRLASASGDGQR